ncbi:MAG: hypothetical protein WBK51_00885 [Polaromonas sp.]
MNFFNMNFKRLKGVRPVVAVGVLLLSISSQACDSDEMIAQMRTACNEMVAGYQKAVGKPLASTAGQSHLNKARLHCQALEFDKAGMTLAMASRPLTVTK